jgi:hypothetical protein
VVVGASSKDPAWVRSDSAIEFSYIPFRARVGRMSSTGSQATMRDVARIGLMFSDKKLLKR